MKNICTLAIAFLVSQLLFAQVQYDVSKDPNNGQKTLKGILSRELLASDTAFTWMHSNISWYKPNTECVTNLTAQKDSIQLLVFIGTWCEDSQIILPQLFKMLDQIKFPADHLTIIGIDRKKQTLGSLCDALGVTKAPTIMVMKNGKELGRVEEFGKYGLYDKELGEILLK